VKVAYIAGAYRASTLTEEMENIVKARKAAILFWRKGYAVICPHMNTAMFDAEIATDIILEGDLAMLSRCDVVVALPNWKSSEGARREIAKAFSLHLKVIFLSEEELENENRKRTSFVESDTPRGG